MNGRGREPLPMNRFTLELSGNVVHVRPADFAAVPGSQDRPGEMQSATPDASARFPGMPENRQMVVCEKVTIPSAPNLLTRNENGKARRRRNRSGGLHAVRASVMDDPIDVCEEWNRLWCSSMDDSD